MVNKCFIGFPEKRQTVLIYKGIGKKPNFNKQKIQKMQEKVIIRNGDMKKPTLGVGVLYNVTQQQ